MSSRWVSQLSGVFVSPNERDAGMLASAETIDVVADALESHGKPLSVVDPVGSKFHPVALWSRFLRQRSMQIDILVLKLLPNAMTDEN